MADHSPVVFAVLLRRLRVDAGLTQEQLAEAAMVSLRAVSDLERGVNQTARKETARLLAGALQLSGIRRAEFEAAARGALVAGNCGEARSAGGTGLAAATRTLPRDVASFTGRASELQQLLDEALVSARSASTVGVYAVGGMAGIGKTAFAVHAAHVLAPGFPDGQIFLQLHGHTPGQTPIDPTEALASLLQTVGIAGEQVPAGLEARARLWRGHLAGKRMLIVLDDVTGHDQVRPLLPGTAGSLVVITSRRHLTALEDAQAISLDTLTPGESAELVVRLAARAGLHAAHPAVGALARSCGYLPLAIGMLARQLHHHPAWTPAGLVSRLGAARDRLAFLRAEDLSVAAAFDLSYRDLTPEQQQLFRQLGLHPGTELDCFAAAALNNSDVSEAQDLLEDLYDHFLLSEPAAGRYRFHDLIAEHARALSATDPAPESDAAIGRLLDYYLHMSGSAGRHLARRNPAGEPAVTASPPRQTPDLPTFKDAVAWMDTEQVNLHAAVLYAARSRPRYAIALPSAMHAYLRHQGNLDHILPAHDAAVRAARQIGDMQAEANALTDLGDIQHLIGAYEAALENLAKAVELHRARPCGQGEANALQILGYVQHLTGSNQAAAISLTRALQLHRDETDLLGEAGTLAYLSYVQRQDGDYQEAKDSLTRALAIHVKLQNPVREAGVLNFLGEVLRLAGDYQGAINSQTQALELYRDLGNRRGEASATYDLGCAQLDAGNHGAATDTLTLALDLFGKIGSPRGEAHALGSLGQLQHALGRYSQATASLTRALELQQKLGHKLGEAEILNRIAKLNLSTSRGADARAKFEQALSVASAIEAPLEEARALEGIAFCQQACGDHARSQETLLSAQKIYQRIGSSNYVTRTNAEPGHHPNDR